jgi:geranylgeranyl reductase family protein
MKVAIIGSGPAGAMAAFRLARAGAAVTLFDPSHPREKPCGGGLTARARALLADVLDLGALPSVTAHSASVEAQDCVVDVPLDAGGPAPERPLVVFSRAVLDDAITRAALAAGARLLSEKVIDVRRMGPRMLVRTTAREVTVDWAIGADGANSLVRKRFASAFSRAQVSLAAGFYVYGVTSPAIAIKTMTEQPGYFWSFPRPDHLAVGVCASATDRVTSTALRRQALSWLERRGLDRGVRLEPYAWPIPTTGFDGARSPDPAGPGWLLAGDAAGLVDPLTREGIYYALLSGQWAAEELSSGSLSRAPGRYIERIRWEIFPELARAARLSRPFFRPAFSLLLVRALQRSAPVRRVFVDLVTGDQPYRGLRRRLLATGEWRLATEAIPLLLVPRFAGTMARIASPSAT